MDLSPETQVTSNGGFAACESPDGKFLYYTKTPVSPTVLARMPIDGGPEEIVAPAIVDRKEADSHDIMLLDHFR